MKKTLLKIILAIVIVTVVSVAFMFWKDQTYYQGEPYIRQTEEAADVLVVYFSRSGHTENMAFEIARRFDADIISIKADAYSLTLGGWNNAAKDARGHSVTPIRPETVDLSNYRLIILGSPIWLFRPAPPLWAFVDQNDFSGKPVVLFNTFNSRFKDNMMQEFFDLVEAKGGQFIDHIYVRRGRIMWQKSGSEVLDETRALLDRKAAEWLEIAVRSGNVGQ